MYMATICTHVAIYETGFGKMCIVHTSDFEHLEIHKIHREWCTELKVSEKIKEWWLYNS